MNPDHHQVTVDHFHFSKNDGAHLLSSRHDSRKAGEHGDVSLLAAKATQSIGNLFSNDGPHYFPQKWSFRLFFQNRIRGSKDDGAIRACSCTLIPVIHQWTARFVLPPVDLLIKQLGAVELQFMCIEITTRLRQFSCFDFQVFVKT